MTKNEVYSAMMITFKVQIAFNLDCLYLCQS